METRARQLGHMTARMVCGFICVLLMSRFMFYCGFTCVLFMMSFRCVYDSLVFAFMLRLRCFMLVLYVFGLCKALSLRSCSYRRSPLGLPNIECIDWIDQQASIVSAFRLWFIAMQWVGHQSGKVPGTPPSSCAMLKPVREPRCFSLGVSWFREREREREREWVRRFFCVWGIGWYQSKAQMPDIELLYSSFCIWCRLERLLPWWNDVGCGSWKINESHENRDAFWKGSDTRTQSSSAECAMVTQEGLCCVGFPFTNHLI